jgi:alcohol-forming fatty acyl-CoA reductase
MYSYYKYMYHLVPAFIIDLYLRAINRTPRLMKLYEKVHKFAHVLEHFTTNQWTFENKNMRTLHEK